MIVWHPDPVTVSQFATRIRQHLGGRGYIFEPEVGFEYRIDLGNLYRVKDGKWIASVGEAIAMDDETLVQRCKG